MRALAAMLAVALAFDAAAQERTATTPPLPPPAPSVTIPPPVVLPPLPLRIRPAAEEIGRWQRARILEAVGTLLSIAGTGLSLASVIYIAAAHYPASSNDLLNPPAPSDTGPVLAYVGASTSAVGFVLQANGLGWQHRVLDRLGVDPGRGMFAVGTTIGLLGFTSVGASYFFGLTSHLDPHDQQVAVLATSIGGAALCAIAGLFYAIDSSRNKKVWKALATF